MTAAKAAAVVIPTWNGREHLRACLHSLSSQGTDDQPIQIIVVDNGSIDESADMVRRLFPQVQLLINDTNRGFAAACNQGADLASAPFVAFLNNDARVDSGWLSHLVDTLLGNEDVAAVGSLVLDWDGKSIDFGRSGLTPFARGLQLDFGQPVGDAPTQATEQLFVNGAAMLVRRELFQDVGGFDERYFAFYEDVDLGWRYWVMGWRVLLEPASRVFHRHHGTSRRLRPEQIDFLLTRNAIASAVKNVGEETFSRFLPVLLLSEGARLATELGSASRFHITGFDEFAFHRVAESSAAKEVRRALGSEAVKLYRHDTKLRSRLAGFVAYLLDPGTTTVRARTAATAVALDDILHGWPDLLSSRASIQARRKRTDRDISPLLRMESQPRHRRSDRVWVDHADGAQWKALEAAGLDWLIPRG